MKKEKHKGKRRAAEKKHAAEAHAQRDHGHDHAHGDHDHQDHDHHDHDHGDHDHSDHDHGDHDHSDHDHGDHDHDHHAQKDAHYSLKDVEARRPALARGSGQGQVLFFDARSGIAGDMTVAALVDLGVPFRVVEEAVAALALEEMSLELSGKYAGAIFVSRFVVRGASRRERTYREIRTLLDDAPLPAEVSALAQKIFARLAVAEGRVHHTAPDDVHFHEVGALDSIADIVGAAAALSYLGATVVASPLPLGHGSVRSRHGVLPLPAPATLECLRGVPTYAAGIEGELVTPTGAAILASVAGSYTEWPPIVPERVGWGGGSRRLADRINALRLVLGRPNEQDDREGAAARAATHIVLEANVDDMTGELVAHAMSELLQSGALDVWAVPCTMKKGRPGLVLSVLVRAADADRMAELVLRETRTLGLRHVPVTRSERPRHVIEVSTRYGAVPVKVALGPYGPAELKPEFDACVEIARAAGVPVKSVLAEALAAARAKVPD